MSATVEELEQPATDSNPEVAYETEDDLLDALRKQAEEAKNAFEGNEPTEVVSDETNDDAPVAEANEDNNEPKPDEEFDVAKWVNEYELPHSVTLKDRDLQIEVKSLAELRDLANKAINYTRKTQELAPIRKVADYAVQHNISIDDLQTLADLKSGNKDALAELAKRNSIDIYDVDTTKEYQPSEQVAYREISEAEMVAQEIAQDNALFGRVKDALTYVPLKVGEQIVSDAKLLSAFKDDVANGVAMQVMPQAVKNYNLYGGDFIEHYVKVANGMFAPTQEQAPEFTGDVKPSNPSSQSKAKASVGSSGVSTSAGELDLWDNVSEDELMDRIRRQASIIKG